MKINWTQEKKDKAIDLISIFMIEYKITCAESAYQRDEVQIDSINLVGDLADLLFPEEEQQEDEN